MLKVLRLGIKLEKDNRYGIEILWERSFVFSI